MIIVVGVILGFRPDASIGGAVAALALVVVFAFGMSWVFTTIGLTLRFPSKLGVLQDFLTNSLLRANRRSSVAVQRFALAPFRSLSTQLGGRCGA